MPSCQPTIGAGAKPIRTGGRVSAGMDQGGTPADCGTEHAADNAAHAADRSHSATVEKRFVAFISYAHADEDIAARLHKQIETYRLPPQLRNATGDAVSRRLGAVFRDRADLAAAESLNAAIQSALADSGALIVLCSPAAVLSHWVNEEIRLFRALNPGAPVLAAIARGEPADAMPTALTEDGREPLAADLRQEGDGRKLGFLKIVAALAGVPLDALIQRDAQRKLRRVMTVTVGALVLLLAAVTMMTYAIQQRNEAQAQRAEAERRRAQADGLAEFMLTDLRERLRGVGRIDIMRLAVNEALETYNVDGRTGELPPDSQGQLARLLHAVVEDASLDRSAGQAEQAQQAIDRAFGITQSLLAAAPEDADRIFNHAQSEYWLGQLAYARGDLIEMQRHWQAYARLAVRLRAVEPNSRRSLQEVAYSEGNLCSAEQMQGRHGVELCRRSFEAQRSLAQRFPNDPEIVRSLANRAGWYADSIERRDGPGASLGVRAEHYRIARRLVSLDPDNFDYREILVSALYSVGTGHVRNNEPARGRALLEEAWPLITAMRRQDPDNQRWLMLEGLLRERLDGLDAAAIEETKQ